MAALSTQDIDYARANMGDPYALGAWQRQKGFQAQDFAGAFGWDEYNSYMDKNGALVNSGYMGTNLNPAPEVHPVSNIGLSFGGGGPTITAADTRPRPTGNALSNFGPPPGGGYAPMAGAGGGGGNALSFGGGGGGGGSMYQNNRRGY